MTTTPWADDDPLLLVYDMCVLLNKASDVPLGTSLLPLAQRCVNTVLDHVIAQAKANPDGLEYSHQDATDSWNDYLLEMGDQVAVWLESLKGDA